MLGLARRAIAARIGGSDLDFLSIEVEVAELSSTSLAQPCGAFVTLTRGSELRGCIGFVEPALPLFRTVMEAAIAAATGDPRFPPVATQEFNKLVIEISVLSPVFPVEPDGIRLGVHGLVVVQGSNKGLLLPRVAIENDWDRARFLGETCRKAGLPATAWKEGASVFAFTAEAFSDAAPRAA